MKETVVPTLNIKLKGVLKMRKNDFDNYYSAPQPECDDGTPTNKFAAIIAIILAILFIGSISVPLVGMLRDDYKDCKVSIQAQQKLDTARESYTYYLDGVEVDLDKIDLDLYVVSYDDDKQEAYMTRNSGQKIPIAPFFLLHKSPL